MALSMQVNAVTHIYSGRSTYTSDILYTTSGHVPIPVLLAVM